jgi:hypothetical protein
MSLPLNPQALNGPNWSSNYTQADYRVPSVNVATASYPVGSDLLNAQPISRYVQPGINGPNGTYPF